MRFALALVCLALPSIALADGLQDLRERSKGPSAAQVLAHHELERQLGARLDVRWDPASGCPAAISCEPPLRLPGANVGLATAHLLKRLEPLFERLALAGQQDRRGPHLFFLARRGLGDWVTIELEQRLHRVPVHESRLLVTLQRTGRGYAVVSLSGRVFADLSAAVARATGPPPSKGLRRVVTCRPDGIWKQGWAGVEFVSTVPRHVLRSDHGDLLSSRSLERGGQALAEVLVKGEGHPPTRVPLPQLHVSIDDGLATTDAQGRFPGSQGSLPFGLSGPFERIATAASRYPSTNEQGTLLVSDSANLAEATAFYHLGRFRRWIRQLPGLGPEQTDTRLLVLVRDSESAHNASASSVGVTFEGRRYDQVLRFGPRMALDSSIVIHERGHALLNRLGYKPLNDAGNIAHEALADFLAVAYTGDPLYGAFLGTSRRDLNVDQIYPQHYDLEDTYGSSLILSGALYDAMRAAGVHSEHVIVAALRGVASGATDMTVLARRMLAAASPQVRSVLEQHLRAHGLLPGSSPPPVVDILSPESTLEPFQQVARV